MFGPIRVSLSVSSEVRYALEKGREMQRLAADEPQLIKAGRD